VRAAEDASVLVFLSEAVVGFTVADGTDMLKLVDCVGEIEWERYSDRSIQERGAKGAVASGGNEGTLYLIGSGVCSRCTEIVLDGLRTMNLPFMPITSSGGFIT